MKISSCVRILLLALLLSPLAQAQTLRWASQGDALTMDPQSQNEGLNNAINGQVYENLTRRDRDLARRGDGRRRARADRADALRAATDAGGGEHGAALF